MAKVIRLTACSVLALALVLSCINPTGGNVVAVVDHGWWIENISPAYWTGEAPPATAFANLQLKYSGDVAATDITSLTVTNPDGAKWSLTPDELIVDTTAKWITAARLYVSDTDTIRLGEWTAVLDLKSGAHLSQRFTFSEPGSSIASHLYATTGMASDVSVAMLALPQVTRANSAGDSIVVCFTVNDQRVKNARVWFYDAGNLLASSGPLVDDSGKLTAVTDAFANDGTSCQVRITPDNLSSTTLTSLSGILRCVVVVMDGAQYAPHFLTYDYRSIGAQTNISSGLSLAAPTFSPMEGTFWTEQDVTIQGAGIAGAEIRYTLDGTEPTSQSTLYTGAIHLTAPTTIKAAVFFGGIAQSSTASGSFAIYPPNIAGMGRIVAMARTTGSLVYAVDNTAAKLYKIDASAKTVTLEANLPYANPTDVEYSSTDETLYICYRFQGVLSRYSLGTRGFLSEYTFTTTPYTNAALDVELSPRRIYVLVPGNGSRVAIVDKSDGTIKLEPNQDYPGSLMAVTPDGTSLFLADSGSSSSLLTRYANAGDVLTSAASIDGGENGESLAVCPDGSSVLFFCGPGNNDVDGGYMVADYSPADLSIKGAWNVGPCPQSGAFSADSQILYAFNGPNASIRVFGRSSYRLIRDLPVPTTGFCMIEPTADNAGLVVLRQDYDGSNSRIVFYSGTDIR